jgi:hypothetical protein
VALDEVAPDGVACPERGLEVHARSCNEPSQRRPAQRLGDSVEREDAVCGLRDREADAADGDRVPHVRLEGGLGAADAQAHAVGCSFHPLDLPQFPNDPCEHAPTITAAESEQSLWLVDVAGDEDVFAHALELDAAQADRPLELSEKPRAVAREDRRDEEHELVDQVGL